MFLGSKEKEKEKEKQFCLEISGRLVEIWQWALMQSNLQFHWKINGNLTQNLRIVNADYPIVGPLLIQMLDQHLHPETLGLGNLFVCVSQYWAETF